MHSQDEQSRPSSPVHKIGGLPWILQNSSPCVADMLVFCLLMCMSKGAGTIPETCVANVSAGPLMHGLI